MHVFDFMLYYCTFVGTTTVPTIPPPRYTPPVSYTPLAGVSNTPSSAVSGQQSAVVSSVIPGESVTPPPAPATGMCCSIVSMALVAY